MELWIRSQDKDSLIKVEKIELNYDYLCCNDIQLIHIETDKGRIGSYSTKERALEVLDEIQSIIIGKYMCDINLEEAFSKIGNEEDIAKLLKQMAVYEMPIN